MAEPANAGSRVLVVAGGGGYDDAGTLTGALVSGLLGNGHLLAVAGWLPTDKTVGEPAGHTPALLASDRTDSAAMERVVGEAQHALGGLDAVVILPSEHVAAVGLDADAAVWSDAWAHTLSSEVLAVACATHAAAALLPAGSGRIVVVVRSGASPVLGRGAPVGSDFPGSDSAGRAAAAAVTALANDLAGQLRGSGIGVSVVSVDQGAAASECGTQVASLVNAILTAPSAATGVRLG